LFILDIKGHIKVKKREKHDVLDVNLDASFLSRNINIPRESKYKKIPYVMWLAYPFFDEKTAGTHMLIARKNVRQVASNYRFLQDHSFIFRIKWNVKKFHLIKK
jgi:hypothetical protein